MKTISKFLIALLAISIAIFSEPAETNAQNVRSGYSVKGTANSQFLKNVAVNKTVFTGQGYAISGASAQIECLDSLQAILLPRISDTTAVDSTVAGLLFFDKTDGVLRYHNGTYWKQVSIE